MKFNRHLINTNFIENDSFLGSDDFGYILQSQVKNIAIPRAIKGFIGCFQKICKCNIDTHHQMEKHNVTFRNVIGYWS